jgi:sugar/nucleoside kinase (ribokinase family)
MSDSGKPFDFVCIGSATQDVFVRSDATQILTLADVRQETQLLCFDYGGKINVEHIEFTTGGGATNAAASLAGMGARVAFLGKIGHDHIGQLVLRELVDRGVDISAHLRSETESTGYSVILTSFAGDRTVLVFRGANTSLCEDEVDWSILDRTDWLYLTSLSGDAAGLVLPLFERAKAAGVRVVWNPGSTQLRAGLARLADAFAATELLLLNREEASRLSGIEATKDPIVEKRCTLCGRCVEICPGNVFARGPDSAFVADMDTCVKCGKCVHECPEDAISFEPWAFNAGESFRRLCDAGPKVVAITDGANGVQASDGDRLWMLPAKDVSVASSLGAGDAFGSAFAFEYRRSGDVGRAMALGVANAASVVQVVGAKNGLLTAEQAKAELAALDRSTLREYALADVLDAARG